MELKIYHMYPDLLNLYGDLGNVTCLAQRCQWRGINVEVVGFSMNRELLILNPTLRNYYDF
jgi:hypothetical protein